MIDRIWCNHDWRPRSGLDSGSICEKCWSITDIGCVPGSGLTGGELRDKQNCDDRKDSPDSNNFWLKFW